MSPRVDHCQYGVHDGRQGVAPESEGQGEGIHLRLGRSRQGRQDPEGRDPGQRPDHRGRRLASAGHRGHQDQEAALQEGRRQDQGRRHHAVHPPAVDDDAGRRAPAPVLRHRGQGHRQRRRREAVHRHQGRCRDRDLAVARLPEISALLRQPVLQPGRCRRAGRYPRRPAGSPGVLQGEDGGSEDDISNIKDMLKISFPNGYCFWYIGKSQDNRSTLAKITKSSFLWIFDEERQGSINLKSNDDGLDMKLLQMFRLYNKTISAALFANINVES